MSRRLGRSGRVDIRAPFVDKQSMTNVAYRP